MKDLPAVVHPGSTNALPLDSNTPLIGTVHPAPCAHSPLVSPVDVKRINPRIHMTCPGCFGQEWGGALGPLPRGLFSLQSSVSEQWGCKPCQIISRTNSKH